MLNFVKGNPWFFGCALAVLINFALLGVGVYSTAKMATRFDPVAAVDVNSTCRLYASVLGTKVPFTSFREKCKKMLRAAHAGLTVQFDRIAMRGLLLTAISVILLIVLVILRRKE